MTTRNYPQHFYKSMGEVSGDVPMRIVDCILEFIRPASVVDVGCGVGDFLACFQRRGVNEIRGVDLSFDTNLLSIPAEYFTSQDLTQPFRSPRRYELVLSLETAEHLPGSAADTFVQTLVDLGDVIVFSAAVPEQTGFRHINLQWQDYWAAKFRSHGYLPVDCIRDKLWRDESVPSFYRQNMIMYVEQNALERYPILKVERSRTGDNSLSRVHPSFYMEKADPQQTSFRFLVRALPFLPRSFFAAVGRRLAVLPVLRNLRLPGNQAK